VTTLPSMRRRREAGPDGDLPTAQRATDRNPPRKEVKAPPELFEARRRRRVRPTDGRFSILRRRYAAGEITTEEYEERRTRLLRDLETAERGSAREGAARTQERHA
jgi:hypothetical protein